MAVVLAGCTSPAERFDRRAMALGLDRLAVTGTEFTHAVYLGAGFGDPALGDALRIYLGSDGTPTVDGQPATDPTPRNPLMLRLMARDPAPAVYVGRPCYHGLVDRGSECPPELWTTARYSEQTVASMAAAIRRLIEQTAYRRLIWFGYSGGGPLAMLLAERFRQTEAVVTIAADLDIDAWADLRGYRRLTKSLNPASRPPLSPDIRQLHYIGSEDRIVPPAVVVNAVRRRGGSVVIVDGFNHVCCWEAIWPEILAQITSELMMPPGPGPLLSDPQ